METEVIRFLPVRREGGAMWRGGGEAEAMGVFGTARDSGSPARSTDSERYLDPSDRWHGGRCVGRGSDGGEDAVPAVEWRLMRSSAATGEGTGNGSRVAGRGSRVRNSRGGNYPYIYCTCCTVGKIRGS